MNFWDEQFRSISEFDVTKAPTIRKSHNDFCFKNEKFESVQYQAG